MLSEYQSDTTCTEFDYDIDKRSNLRQKSLKYLDSNISVSKATQHQIRKQNIKHRETSDLTRKHQKQHPWFHSKSNFAQ